MVISFLTRWLRRPRDPVLPCDSKHDRHLSLVVERQPCKLKVMGSTPIDGFVLFLLGTKAFSNKIVTGLVGVRTRGLLHAKQT